MALDKVDEVISMENPPSHRIQPSQPASHTLPIQHVFLLAVCDIIRAPHEQLSWK